MARNVITNRQASPAPDAGRIYSVGCLPLLLVWFLVDLIGKAIIFGIASLFGKPMPLDELKEKKKSKKKST